MTSVTFAFVTSTNVQHNVVLWVVLVLSGIKLILFLRDAVVGT